jgi:hypothetical protein
MGPFGGATCCATWLALRVPRGGGGVDDADRGGARRRDRAEAAIRESEARYRMLSSG